MNALEIENLTYSYDGITNVVEGISFALEQGKFVSVIGHNGSGKSTLAKLIIGLLPKKSGSIKVFDVELDKDNLADIRKRIGIVFQNPDNQFISATVEDDIAFGLENHCVKHDDMQTIVNEYAEKVGMKQFLNKEPANLSGGQKQRVAIAGVLAMNPDIIIFDEATSMLDPKGKSDIRSLIIEMRKSNPNLTILSITHDIEEAYLSDEVIVMSEGKNVLKGKPEEVFSNREVLEKISLSTPFLLEVKDKLSSIGIKTNDAKNLDELVELICQ